jgi:hypothetical protein
MFCHFQIAAADQRSSGLKSDDAAAVAPVFGSNIAPTEAMPDRTNARPVIVTVISG